MGMEKPSIKDYYITKEDGTKEFDETKYDSDLQAFLDDERRKASETAKQKGIQEGKKQASDEAKLTAEQKFAKEKEEWKNEMREKTIGFNKRIVKEIYQSNGYSDKEIEVLLPLVNDDEEGSIQRAKTLCESRKSYQDEYKKKILEETQKNQDNLRGDGTNGDGKLSFAQQKAQEINAKFSTKE